MSEVLFEMPVRNEDYDSGWRRVSYCMSWDDDPPGYGEYTVCDEEGYHDPIDKDDVNHASARHEEAWKEYGEYVARTGLDPLSEYFVPRTYKRKVRYTVEFRNSIGGAYLCRWRRGARGAWTLAMPDKLLADAFSLYSTFGADPGEITRRCLEDHDPQTGKRTYLRMAELEKLALEDERCKVTVPRGMGRYPALHMRWFHLLWEETVDRSPAAIARDLKRLAKRRLRK